ncbi:hypothetical protein NM688_g4159 [Phlebia brevispora]|uniref:Uncharacterized protein n=1 Tax=Phlebia brevispora TaxID=194682 RepID=A0ACC1T3J0_9APHY|nr:hypothetical protein NM688_g4159 [Phlebia brevispora]
MPPYLDTVTSFADVPVTDAGVDTVEFLKASEGVVGLFDLLGNAAFSVVQNDLSGNITKLKTRLAAAPGESTTLELLVKNEQGEKKRPATEGLLWLLRGLDFTCQAMQKLQADKSTEMTQAFTDSYQVTLRQYHNFVVRGIFGVAMKAVPYRATFFTKLCADPNGGAPATQEKLDVKFNSWLGALDSIVKRMQKFYEDGGYGKGF